MEVQPQGTPVQAAVRFRGNNPHVKQLAKTWAISNDDLAWSYIRGSSFVVLNNVNADNLYNDYHGVFLNALAAAQANGDQPNILKLVFGHVTIPETMVKTMGHALTIRMERVMYELAQKPAFTHEYCDFSVISREKTAA